MRLSKTVTNSQQIFRARGIPYAMPWYIVYTPCADTAVASDNSQIDAGLGVGIGMCGPKTYDLQTD